ncbi:hypothetical protein BCE75_10967 [Isoptericola sp. CG 20/1183]|uniref:DUF8094 domain-containing protein n=1 Tax=Isoptericola halotolerans TaxID=300560 RepID=A0ABX5EBV3_9MICO|nr:MULTISPECIES: hypothetical protein [Isoptericola]PRZ04829.1 hypothetical protein BCL65_10968 [Isoptericola halotolerans]PRZ05320.1 hypothetical protein BCE75_10967 [Isoptericola sp. CG 20/1183]
MTARTTRVARRTSAAVGVAATAALLAGCAEELPTPAADEPFEGPVLTMEQETAVVQDVGSVLEQAGEESDPKILRERVGGPAYEVRRSQIKVAEARGDDSLVTQIPTELRAAIIPTTESWPRVTYTITQPTENLEVPRMVAYQQESARDNYKLWSWVQLIPGTTMPNFADPEAIGSEEVAADDDSLTVTPADAVAQYADLVTKGPEESEYADAFELPGDSQDLVKRIQADARNVRGADTFDAADGRYRLAFAARDEPLTVRTSDGGAVVMGVLDGNVRLDVEEGGTIPPLTETQSALLEGEDETNELYVEYTDQVALYVPPAGSEEPMRPLGYSHVAVDAANEIPSERNTDR